MSDVYLFKSYLFCRPCIDQTREQLDKLGRRPALTDQESDPEIYPLKLEKASEEEPEDWKMECCICDRHTIARACNAALICNGPLHGSSNSRPALPHLDVKRFFCEPHQN